MKNGELDGGAFIVQSQTGSVRARVRVVGPVRTRLQVDLCDTDRMNPRPEEAAADVIMALKVRPLTSDRQDSGRQEASVSGEKCHSFPFQQRKAQPEPETGRPE